MPLAKPLLRVTAVLTVVTALPMTAYSESLLIVEPVVNEVLGNLVSDEDGFVFLDCRGDKHDPAQREIRVTQDTCDGQGIVIASGIEGIINKPVFAADESLVGTIASISVTGSGNSLAVSIVDAAGKVNTGTMSKDEWSEALQGQLVLNEGGSLKWNTNAD